MRWIRQHIELYRYTRQICSFFSPYEAHPYQVSEEKPEQQWIGRIPMGEYREIQYR